MSNDAIIIMESAEAIPAKTENEMETEDATNSDGGSRKRPLDAPSDHEESLVKRSNLNDDEQINLKVMIPTQTAGALIGKNGETIAVIQKETTCRVKMSKSNDFFPSTNERLALITGPANCISKVIEFVVEKTKEKYDSNAKPDLFDHKQTERWKEIKLIIPSSAAGMVIGKGGEYIKSIKDQTGAFVQISPKDQVDHRLQERVVTIVGNTSTELVDGTQMIIAKLLLDPNQSSPNYTNVSYHNFIADTGGSYHHGGGGDYHGHGRSVSPSSGYVAPFSSGGHQTPYHNRSSYSPSSNANYSNYHYQSPPPSSSVVAAPPSLGSTGGLGSSLSLASIFSAFGAGGGAASSSFGNTQVLQFLEGLRSTLRNNGYNEPAIAEIMHAMQVLAKYNVLGLGLGFGLAAVSKVGQSPRSNGGSFETAGMFGGDASGLNAAAFVAKDMNTLQAFGAVGASRQANVGFAGFDSPMMDVNESYGSSRRAAGGVDRSAFGYGESDGSREQPLYVSRSSGSRYDDNGPSASSRSDYASSVVREYKYEPNKLELAIPEAIIGAVLGKQGRNLLEIQHFSGAKVEVSKRGQYVPGTQDRLITIVGSAESIRVARSHVERSINDEQSKRNRRF